MAIEVNIVRIYLSEADHGAHGSLMQEALNLLSKQLKVRNVTVFRGIAGSGASGAVHASDVLRILVDLPIVIEFFDKPEAVNPILTMLKTIIPEGRIVSWVATCQ